MATQEDLKDFPRASEKVGVAAVRESLNAEVWGVDSRSWRWSEATKFLTRAETESEEMRLAREGLSGGVVRAADEANRISQAAVAEMGHEAPNGKGIEALGPRSTVSIVFVGKKLPELQQIVVISA